MRRDPAGDEGGGVSVTGDAVTKVKSRVGADPREGCGAVEKSAGHGGDVAGGDVTRDDGRP